MQLNMTVDQVQNSLPNLAKTVLVETQKWIGYSVLAFKNGSNKIAPYFQDKVIAIASVVVATLLIDQIGLIVREIPNRILPERTEKQKIFRDLTSIALNFIVLGGGITLFAKFTKLPLHGLTITGIAILTIMIKAACEKDVKAH